MSKEIIKNKNIIILGVSGGGRKPRNLMHLANQIHNKGIVEKSEKVIQLVSILHRVSCLFLQ